MKYSCVVQYQPWYQDSSWSRFEIAWLSDHTPRHTPRHTTRHTPRHTTRHLECAFVILIVSSTGRQPTNMFQTIAPYEILNTVFNKKPQIWSWQTGHHSRHYSHTIMTNMSSQSPLYLHSPDRQIITVATIPVQSWQAGHHSRHYSFTYMTNRSS